MNKVTTVIAGGLLLGATALIGCGDAEKVSALEAQLKEAEQRTLFVADSISLECQAKMDAMQAEMAKAAAANTEPAAEKPAAKTEPKTSTKTTSGSKLDVGQSNDKSDAKRLDVGQSKESTKGKRLDVGQKP